VARPLALKLAYCDLLPSLVVGSGLGEVAVSYLLAHCETGMSGCSIQLGFGFKASYNAFKSHCGFAFTLPSGCGKDYDLELFSISIQYLSLLTSHFFLSTLVASGVTIFIFGCCIFIFHMSPAWLQGQLPW